MAKTSFDSSKLNRLHIFITWSLDRQFFAEILFAVLSLVSSKLLLPIVFNAAAKFDEFIGQPLHSEPELLLELVLPEEFVVVVVVVVVVSEKPGSFTETFILTPLIFTLALTPLVVVVVVVVGTMVVVVVGVGYF